MRHVRVRLPAWYLVCALLLKSAPSTAQIVNPADKQTPSPPKPVEVGDDHHTWTMPPVEVFGKAPLREEDRIGDYAQPRWTAHRRFGETRVYVVPKGMVEFEYWLRPTTRAHAPTEVESQYEFEFGLPGRVQVDLYAVAHKTGREGTFGVDEQKVEVRYAFADWNRIFGNPTIYAEWAQQSNGPDVAELKMLFGGEIASGWHWGSNLVWEHQMGGALENSNEWTTGLSRTIRDTRLSVGVETQLALVNERIRPGVRSPFETEFLIGPSLQFRPLPQVHIDVAPLFGSTVAAPRAKTFVVFGWEF